MESNTMKRFGAEERLDRLYTEGWRPRQVEGNRLMTDLAYLIDKAVRDAYARPNVATEIEDDVVMCFMSAAVHVAIERMGRARAIGWLHEAADQIQPTDDARIRSAIRRDDGSTTKGN